MNQGIGFLAMGFFAVTSMSSAQMLVKDSDQEARNAYQERCHPNSANNTPGTGVPCTFSPLPAGKRLAMREISTFCSYNGNRFAGMTLAFWLSHQNSAEYVGIRNSMSSIPGGSHAQTNSIYAHTDVTPNVTIYLNPNTSGLTMCAVTIRGFLVDQN
ncbi:MAG TPA: hypothetical protein VES20_09125 [Bryobacteraceae bacterium]|nr:hypothetical protein [Bryobacteraceae bacterium]